MSREEDLIRSTTRAIASTIREVPPLQLGQATQATKTAGAADELRFPARAPGGPRAPRPRRGNWRGWAIPVTAAALVVTLAVSLVIVKNLHNGGGVPAKDNAATAGPGGVPRYYVALKNIPADGKPGQVQARNSIVVGDTVTGAILTIFTPPANTSFQSVSAAADDRAFVVFAVTSATGAFGLSPKADTLTGSWYLLRLSPGGAYRTQLSKLPVKPQSWKTSPKQGQGTPNAPAPGEIFATALSADGRELAVADVPDTPAAATKTGNWHEVRVFSVATGRLLHDWTEDNPGARLFTVLQSYFAAAPVESVLTWIDGDRALALATSTQVSSTVTGTIRRLDLSGPASGDLKNAPVTWTGTLSWNDFGSCFAISAWPPQLSANGKALTCLTINMPQKSPGSLGFGTAPLTARTPASVKPTISYRAGIPPENKTGGVAASILWVSPSAGTLIVEWEPGGNLSPHKQYFGVVSHGKFTPLRIPASLMNPTTGAYTF